MRKEQAIIGMVYVVKVSGKLARVRLDRESPYGGYDATNLDTGRKIRLRTAGRLRRVIT